MAKGTHVGPGLVIVVLNGHTGNETRWPITDLDDFLQIWLWCGHLYVQHLIKIAFADWYPEFIKRAVVRCGLHEVTRFLSKSHCMLNPFLCECNTTESSVTWMNQAWNSRLSKTLRIVSDDNTDKDSILSVINWSYNETTTGPITSAQCEIDKLFVKIVCTAFSVCTTAPTKNIPHFELHKKSKSSDGRNLQTLNQELYRDIQKEIQCQIDKTSHVMISEITAYQNVAKEVIQLQSLHTETWGC